MALEKHIYKKKKKKVYVIQEVIGRNILGAGDFGNLEAIMPPNLNIMLCPENAVKKMLTALRNFSDDDHLLLMGDPALIGIACSIASLNNSGKFKVLKWDKQECKYYSVSINIFKKRIN